MVDTLCPLDSISDEERREEIERLARCLQKVPDDNTWALLVRQRDACQRVAAIAHQHPDTVSPLAPLLAATLGRELRREYGFTADALVAGVPSADIQTACAQALAHIAGSSLVESYDASPHSLRSLVEPLVETVSTGETTEAKVGALKALAATSWAAPELVTEIADIETFATSTGRLVSRQLDADDPPRRQPDYIERSEIPGQQRKRSGLRMLLAVAVQAPEQVPTNEAVVSAVRTGLATNWQDNAVHDFRCQAYASVLNYELGAPVENPLDWARPDSNPVSALEDVVARTARSGSRLRLRAAVALASVTATGLEFDCDLPSPLVELVSDKRNSARQFYARSLGEAVAASVRTNSEGIDALAEALESNDSKAGRRYITCAIGALATASDDVETAVPDLRSLAPDSWISPGRVRPLELVGEAVIARRRFDGGLSESCCRAIRADSGRQRRRSATALGVCVLASGTTTSVDLPTFREWNGWDEIGGFETAEICGRYVAAAAAESDESHLLTNVLLGTVTGDREVAAEALGALVIDDAEARTAVPQAILRTAREASSATRSKWALRAIGATKAAHDEYGTSLADELRTAVVSSDRRRYEQATKALISAVSTDLADAIASPESLISEINLADNPSLLKLRVLGEFVAAGVVGTEYPTLVDRVAEATGNSPREALGAVITAQASRDIQVPRAVIDAVVETEDSSQERKMMKSLERAIATAAQHEGEFSEAVRSAKPKMWSVDRRYAWILGELALRGRDDALVPEPLLDHVRPTTGVERRFGAQLIGEVVTADSTYEALNALAYRVTEHTTERVEELRIAAESGAFEAETYLRAITDFSEGERTTAGTIAPYFEFPESERQCLFEAIGGLLERAGSGHQFPTLRRQLEYFLDQQAALTVSTRLTILDILAKLDT